MVARAADRLREGDVAAARLMLERGAAGGDAAALLALGETYDPAMLARLGVRGGVRADIDRARDLYKRARESGSLDAGRRLEAMR